MTTLSHIYKYFHTQTVFLFVREVKNHLNYEHRVFNSEEFLKTRAPGDQQFYRQVRSTCARVFSPAYVSVFTALFTVRFFSIC